MVMTRRTERVAEALQELVADLLLREIKDPRIGLVTVTGVKVSPDLRHATVFVSLLDEGPAAAATLAALESASGFLRVELGRRMRLKNTPNCSSSTTPRPVARRTWKPCWAN